MSINQLRSFYWRYDGDDWNVGCDSVEDCIRDAIFENEEEEWEEDYIYIGKENYFQPSIDMDSFIENQLYLAEDYDVADDYDNFFLNNASNEELKELEDKFQEIYVEWLTKYNLYPYVIDNIQRYSLKSKNKL